jgi:hypothetical protein
LREQLNKDNEKVLQEKDAAWANNLHRISRELEDKERLVQEMTIEYDATKSVLLDVQQQLRSTKAGITMPHQNDSEISKLKGELKQKSLDFQAKQDEIERLRTEHIELQAKAAVLEESVERFNAQLSEQKRLTETLRAEVDARKAEQCNDFVLLQDALDRELALEKGKNGLESSLENARANGASSLKHAEAELTKEKKKLQDQIVQLHTAKEETDRELQRVREQFAEETKTSENYRTEVTNLKLQLEQMSASLGGSHSVQERIEYEYARDQETHERVTKEKMQKKFLEESLAYQKKVDRRKEEEITEIRHQLTQKNRATPEWDSVLSSSRAHASEPCSSNAKKSLLVSLSYSRSRPRKKVSRESNTVFSVDASSNPPSRIFSNDSTTFVESQNPHSLGVRRELMSPSTFNGLGTLEQLDEEGVSFCQSPEEAVSESQQELFSTEAFPDMLMSQAPSSLPGTGQEPIENLEQRASGTPLSTRPTNDQSLSKSAEENNGNTQAHASFNSLSFFNISNLSKSQANTGSQVIPQPPAPFSIKSRKEAQSGSLKTVRPQTGEPKQGFEETVTATSSPDLLHDGSSSATKRTYTNHHIANTPSSRMPHPVSTSMEIVETPSRKRKGSVILSEPGMSKRHIPSSSLSIRGSKYPSLPSQSPVSSRAVRHSRSPMKCSQQAIQSSTGRGSAPRRTKSKCTSTLFVFVDADNGDDRYDFRFS